MYSQNGWHIDPSRIRSYTIDGSNVRINLRMGDASVVLLWVAAQYNAHVEPLTQADTGGFVIKGIEGGISLSNHASGTAMDLRWNKHPMGRRGTYGPDDVATIQRILAACRGVVRWGGSYVTRADEMHWEIVGTADALHALANRIRDDEMPDVTPEAKPKPKPSTGKAPKFPGTLKQGMHNNKNVGTAQAQLKHRGWNIKVDDDFGPRTDDIVRQFQHEKHLKVDGIIGPDTWGALWTAPVT